MLKLFTENIKNPQFWLRIVLASCGLVFIATAVGNHYMFKTFIFDYGSYNFAFYDYAHFRISQCPLYLVWGSHNTFLQDHFSFTLMYLVPFYWLFNWITGTYTLLILQTLLVIISGWAVYKFVSDKTGNQWLGLFAILQYFLLQGRFSSFTGDVNISVISSCFIPLYLYFFHLKNFVLSTIILILALFSRENMPIWFMSILIMQAYWYRNDAKILKISAIYFILCVTYFVLLFKLFIPLLETPEKKYSLFEFSALGKTPTEALMFIVKHPIKTLELLFVNHSGNYDFNDLKREFYLVYLISGGFLLFLRPIYLLWFIPPLALKMFNDSPNRWGIEWYYSIEIVTILPISLSFILADLKLDKWQPRMIFAVLFLTLFVSIYKSSSSRRKAGWWGTSKECVFYPNFFRTKYDIKRFHEDLCLIPANASVSASGTLLPHLSQRDSIFYFPNMGMGKVQYLVFMETFKDNYVASEEGYMNSVKGYLNSPDWEILAHHKPLVILKRKSK